MTLKRYFKIFSKKHTFLIHCLAFFFFALASFAQAGNVTLIWQPSDPPADTYRIFQRTSSQTYNYSEWVYQGFETTCVITDLAPDTIYYFIVRAYSNDAESADSNEVSYSTWTYTPDYMDDEIYTPDYQDNDTYIPGYQDNDNGTAIVFNDGNGGEDPYEIR
jgi:hypothetical protein